MKSCIVVSFVITFYSIGCFCRIPCPPCSKITCMPVNCTKNEVLKPKGFCGCCDVCYTILKEGDVCISHLVGAPFNAECGQGLECKPYGDTRTCQK